MKYGREKGVPFSPRAGHHCVTTTMRHLQNGILIDMRSLNSLTFDEKKRQVTVGGGVITDDFVRFLESKGMEVSELIFVPGIAKYFLIDNGTKQMWGHVQRQVLSVFPLVLVWAECKGNMDSCMTTWFLVGLSSLMAQL